MSTDLLNAIGEPFEKLLKIKQKPIFLSQTLNQKKFSFLTQFKQGLKTYPPIEQGTVEEISEDPTETLYFLALFNEGANYTLIVSEKKDCWIIRDIRMSKKGVTPAQASSRPGKKRKRRISLPLIFLIVISAAGYFYQFGMGKTGQNANPTLAELYSNSGPTQMKQPAGAPVSTVGGAAKASAGVTATPAGAGTAIPTSKANTATSVGTAGGATTQGVNAPTAGTAATPASTANSSAPIPWAQQKAALEKEKADLEKQVAALKKENEALRKQIKPAQ